MGIDTNYPLLVFLVILGCAAGVMLAWAGAHFWTARYAKPAITGPSAEQAQYMREVRLKNVEDLAYGGGTKRTHYEV